MNIPLNTTQNPIEVSSIPERDFLINDPRYRIAGLSVSVAGVLYWLNADLATWSPQAAPTASSLVFGNPLSTSAANTARLDALIQLANESGIQLIELGPYTYQWSGHATALSNVTIRSNPKTHHVWTLPFVGPPWISNDPPWSNSATTITSGDTDPGSVVVRVADASAFVTNLATYPDTTYVEFTPINAHQSYRVLSADAGADTITLAEPTCFSIASGSAVYLFEPLHNFRLEFNGCTGEATFTGVWTDARIVDLICVWNCYQGGISVKTLVNPPQATFGFDLGGVHNLMEHIEVTGVGPDYAQNVDSVSIECQRFTTVRDIVTRNNNSGPWFNSCYGCIADGIVGINVANGVWLSPLSSGDPEPNRNMTFGSVKVHGLTAGGSGFSGTVSSNGIGSLADSTIEDLNVDGITVGSNAGLNLDGACVNVHAKRVRAINVGAAVRGQDGSMTIDDLSFSGCSNIVRAALGQSVVIKHLSGDVTHGVQFYADVTSSIRAKGDAITINRGSSTNIFADIGGTLELEGFTVTHSGSGAEYGFVNMSSNTPGALVALTDCALGAWATNFEAMLPGDTVRLSGSVSYTGSLQYAHFNRQTVAINGTTPVLVRYPRISATSNFAGAARKTTGGTPGASPICVAVPGSGDTDITVSGMSSTELVGFPGSFPHVVPSTNSSSHVLLTNVPGWSSGVPVLARVQASNYGYNFLGVGDGAGHYAVVNLTTGAISESAGGVVAWARNDGAGRWTLFVYSAASWAGGGAIYCYVLQSDIANVVYSGNGTSGINVYSVTTSILGCASITGTAGDTSQYAITID